MVVEQTLIARAFDAYKAKKYEKAARGFYRALDVNPSNPSTLYNLACCYALLKKEKLAVRCLAVAYQAGFRDLEHMARDKDFDAIRKSAAYKGLVREMKQAREYERLTEWEVLRRAAVAYRAKRYEDAARCFIAALRKNPTNAETIYNLSCSLALLGKKDAAIQCLAAAWRAGFQDLGYIRRDVDFRSVRNTAAFKHLMWRFEQDLRLSREIQRQRYMAYIQYARQQQARLAQMQAAQARSVQSGSGGGGGRKQSLLSGYFLTGAAVIG
jgi:tetratricopeptide (TPR) repeat protein